MPIARTNEFESSRKANKTYPKLRNELHKLRQINLEYRPALGIFYGKFADILEPPLQSSEWHKKVFHSLAKSVSQSHTQSPALRDLRMVF